MAGRLPAGVEAKALPVEFDAWMIAEQKRIYLLCRRFLEEKDEADTATQEVFLKAYRALSRGQAPPIEEPSKWLTRVAVNTCLDRLRSRRWRFRRARPNPEEEDTILAFAATPEPNSEDLLFARQISGRLSAALEKLSLRQRSVFTLRHYEDRSLEEIADILGLDVGTVKAHMARAVAKLRSELHDLYSRPPVARAEVLRQGEDPPKER